MIPAHRSNPFSARRAHRHGFSLVEILIAVFVLALGLLGLGAVFPVAIADQREGEDKTLGVSVAESAIEQLKWIDIQSVVGAAGVDYGVWEAWAVDVLDQNAFENGEWAVFDVDPDTGASVINPPQGPFASVDVKIPLSDRLFPQTLTPQFVYDLAIHRVPNSTPTINDDAIQLAVFLRRIDPRVKPAQGFPLYQVLTGDGLNAQLRQIPLSADANGLPLPGGQGPFYSTPQRLAVDVDYDASRPETLSRDILEFRRPTTQVETELVDAAMRVGQRLVDNLGNVYEVVASDREQSRYRVRVTPPIPPSITEASLTGAPTTQSIREVVFTPQRPAAVFVTRIDK